MLLHWPVRTSSAASDIPKVRTGAPIKQKIDLLALADPTKDRIAVINGQNHSRGNNWKRASGALVFSSDGGSGKIASPVAIDSRNYEIEVDYERLSGNGRLHVDIPVNATNQGMTLIPIYLDAPGFQIVGMKSGGSWPADGKSNGRGGSSTWPGKQMVTSGTSL